MRKLFSTLLCVALYVTLAYGQAAIDIPIIVSDNAGNTRTLYIGLDPTATTGIDVGLGESDLPPFPPAGAFEIRWTLQPFGVGNLSTYRDYRNAPAFPFSGTIQHRLIWQYDALATSLTITYNLPAGVAMEITQNSSSPSWTSGVVTDSGSFTLNDPENEFTAARVFVTYTNVAPADPGPLFGINPPALSFGSVFLGQSSNLTATISNAGNANPLIISNIVSSNAQFTFAPNTFPITVAPSSSVNLTVTFTPTALGAQSATLTFTHNAPGSPFVYNLSGDGADPAPVFSAPASLSFGSVNQGNSLTLPLTVNNTGANPLVITGVVASPSQFTVSPTSATIPGGGSQVFNVTFTPTAGGLLTGTLTFTHNAAGSPSVVNLSGSGIAVFGLIFEKDTVRNLEDSIYVEKIQLKFNDPSNDPKIQALQFRILVNKSASDNVFLTFMDIQKGSDVSDPSWNLQYNVRRGPLTSNGASVDTIFVLLYNLLQNNGLNEGDYNNLLKVKYRVADLPALVDTAKSTFRITNAEASTYQGNPIDITPSRDNLVVLATNRVRSYGDVNGDGYIDILDLIDVVDHIVGRDSLDTTKVNGTSEFTRADIAPWTIGAPDPLPDGVVNVRDLSVIQNIILTGFYPSGVQVNKPTSEETPIALNKSNGDEEAKLILYLNTKGITMHLDSKVGIRGIQTHFGRLTDNPGNMTIDTELGGGFFLHQMDLLKVLLYDQSGEKYIEAGRHYAANLPFTITRPQDVTLDKLILVSIDKRKLTNIKVEIIYGDAPLPYDYELFQNYPNPFNPSTSVMFTVPKNGLVNIKVYDMLGQEVATLVNEVVDRGVYTVNWDGKNEQGSYVSSGNYIYRMVAGDFVKSRKMMLIK